MTGKFTFDTKLDAKDIWWFSFYHSNKGFLGIFNILFSLACFFNAFFNKGLSTSHVVLLIFCGLIFTVIQPVILFLKSLKQAKTDAIKAGVNIVFTDDDIKVSRADTALDIAWDKVYYCMLRPNMIVIYFDNIRAYVIPRRYYLGQEKEVIEFLKSKSIRINRF